MNYDRAIRRIRNNWEILDSDKGQRVLGKLLEARRKFREKNDKPEPRGQYSGLTKRELGMSGTCETDWY